MFSKSEFSWEIIVEEYTKNPRDVITVPIGDKNGKWFYVHTEDGNVFITDAEYHSKSSRVNKPIKLQKNQFEAILNLYHKRKSGEAVSQEAKDVTYHQVYWYGIFADMGI